MFNKMFQLKMYLNKNPKLIVKNLKGFSNASFVKTRKYIGLNSLKAPAFLKVNHKRDIKKLFKLLSVSSDLKQKVFNDINFLKDIRCFSGIRHRNRLPCRGQRTRTNSRTVRSRY